MWGTLLIPIFAYLTHSGVQKLAPAQSKPNWKLAFSLGLGFTFFLFLLAFAIAWVGSFVEKDFVFWFLNEQGMSAGQFIGATSLRRLEYIASLVTLLAILIPALAYLFPRSLLRNTEYAIEQTTIENQKTKSQNQFVLLILALGTILVLVPEFVYLRDQFGYRINTIFKFYYQAWMLWSLAAAFGTAYLLQNLRGVKNIVFSIIIGLVIFSGLLYPALGLLTKTNNFKPFYGFTLDDFDRIVRENPDEAAAIEFLRTVPNGVIAEAVGDGYSAYARISTYTGLQTVIGWPGHESQWRGDYAPQGSRREDITKLYSTTRWEEAQSIIDQYDIRYIYIGNLEYASMPVREEKFQVHLKPVFQQGGVVIYEVP
jgi:uncharacterized membrane protein